jgi:hypothetical protein
VNVNGRTIADYDWCWRFTQPCTNRCETHNECDCIDEQLHAPCPATNTEFDDWDGDPADGETACGIKALLTIPGLSSPMSDPRCPACCQATGMPEGNGSPKNDDACRVILWPPTTEPEDDYEYRLRNMVG